MQDAWSFSPPRKQPRREGCHSAEMSAYIAVASVAYDRRILAGWSPTASYPGTVSGLHPVSAQQQQERQEQQQSQQRAQKGSTGKNRLRWCVMSPSSHAHALHAAVMC